MTRPLAAALMTLCTIPALAGTVINTRLSDFSISYTDLNPADAYTPSAVDWSTTEIDFGSWNWHDQHQEHYQTLQACRAVPEI
ncbi:hypothetical protein [Massilia sp. YMA4]|uniref:hypothetical protein n=1 Tax=Massilia sp. YMA4 TaxID=1593482 RepID=UPI000DD18524|nr:hypothetical protein [Massilia sp. YMA4]AXA91863.1 hypothetical protein DPH57_12345 [Massilia sp. YMA4]